MKKQVRAGWKWFGKEKAPHLATRGNPLRNQPVASGERPCSVYVCPHALSKRAVPDRLRDLAGHRAEHAAQKDRCDEDEDPVVGVSELRKKHECDEGTDRKSDTHPHEEDERKLGEETCEASIQLFQNLFHDCLLFVVQLHEGVETSGLFAPTLLLFGEDPVDD